MNSNKETNINKTRKRIIRKIRYIKDERALLKIYNYIRIKEKE
ncbi:MAG: hypothetical protein NSGCLCUN01_02731 [uncultured Clostridium sp.]